MSPPNEEGRGEAAPGTALDTTDHTARGKPNASGNSSEEPAVRQAKNCTTCGGQFVPARAYYRKCTDCATRFKAACMDLAKQRNADGVTVFRLLEHMHALRSDDPAARAWLAALIEDKRTE